MTKATKRQDLTSGPILTQIIKFSIPLILTGVLQLLFNAADLVVVGQYGSDASLAAVGTTGALINLIINLFMGLSAGVAVSVSQAYGAEDYDGVHRIVHTAISLSAIAGVVVAVVGFCGSGLFLSWMDTPEEGGVLRLATQYMRIYFIGVPATMIYNYGAAIVRSLGDTKRPLYILIFAGIVNVILNLILVMVFKLDVAGVAIATAVSQVISAAAIILHLMRVKECYRLDIKKLRFYKNELMVILKIGIPAGIQGSVFSISNVLIQSSINSFGAEVMSGNAAAGNLDGFIYTAMNAFHHTALTFAGQNLGARRKKRIDRSVSLCLILVVAVGLVMGVAAYVFSDPLLSIYIPEVEDAVPADGDMASADMPVSSPDDAVPADGDKASDDAPMSPDGAADGEGATTEKDPYKAREEKMWAGKTRLMVVGVAYCLCGFMDVMSGAIRGLGASLVPMLITIFSVCGSRILWIYTVFARYHDLTVLYICYPMSWVLCIAIQLAFFFYHKKKVFQGFSGTEEMS